MPMTPEEIAQLRKLLGLLSSNTAITATLVIDALVELLGRCLYAAERLGQRCQICEGYVGEGHPDQRHHPECPLERARAVLRAMESNR